MNSWIIHDFAFLMFQEFKGLLFNMAGIVWLWLCWSYRVHSDLNLTQYKDEGLEDNISLGYSKMQDTGLC